MQLYSPLKGQLHAAASQLDKQTHAVDRLKFKYNIHYNENIIEHLQGLMRFLTI